MSSLTEVVEVAPPAPDVMLIGPDVKELFEDVVSGSRYDNRSMASTQLSGNNCQERKNIKLHMIHSFQVFRERERKEEDRKVEMKESKKRTLSPSCPCPSPSMTAAGSKLRSFKSLVDDGFVDTLFIL